MRMTNLKGALNCTYKYVPTLITNKAKTMEYKILGNMVSLKLDLMPLKNEDSLEVELSTSSLITVYWPIKPRLKTIVETKVNPPVIINTDIN